jgi:HAD superfamily hydrolase (TIGR01509 family)
MFKRLIENKKAAFFDLDGTVVDTEPYFFMAFEQVLNEVSPSLLCGSVYGQVGEPIDQRWDRIIKAAQVKGKTAKELTDRVYTEFVKLIRKSELRERPGFWDLIYELKAEKGFKTALVTNTAKAVANVVIDKLELRNAFDLFLFGDEVSRKKPDPEIYLTAAKKLEIHPREVLAFEDSITGARAVQKAGMALVVIWDGRTDKSLFPENTEEFMPGDFTGLAGNLDMTPKERVEAYFKATQALQRPQTQK